MEPKRLDKLAALKEQEHFFRKNNFQNAWQKCITQYRWDITDSFIELDKAEISNKSKYKRYIKKYLRYVLRYDKQHLTMRTRPDLFKQAYPFFSECYWVIKGIKNKFKR